MNHVLYVDSHQLLDLPVIDGFEYHILTKSWEVIDFIEENHVDMIFITVLMAGTEEEVENAELKQLISHIKKIDALVPIFLLTNKNTVHLEALAYRLQLFKNIEYPLPKEQLLTYLNEAILYSSFIINKKKITLKTKSYEQTYLINDIIAVERTRHRTIAIISYDKQEKQVISDEYPFRFPLGTFPEKFNIKRYLKQCHQSYLINPAYMIKVDRKEMEMTLKYNIRIPVTVTFIEQFLKGKKD